MKIRRNATAMKARSTYKVQTKKTSTLARRPNTFCWLTEVS